MGAGMRGRVITDRSSLWKGGPFKALTKGKSSSGGRNAQGRITNFHRGGGHKRLYRIIDFKRDMKGVPGTLERVEYDPNRTARIALVKYPAGKAAFSYKGDKCLPINGTNVFCNSGSAGNVCLSGPQRHFLNKNSSVS